jgi:outer membrane lipoprotein-sorting protein
VKEMDGMARLYPLLLVLLLAVPARSEELTARAILERAATTYRSLDRYGGSVTILELAGAIRETTPPPQQQVELTFSRPGYLRVEGKDLLGHPFRLVSDRAATWLSRKNAPAERKPDVASALWDLAQGEILTGLIAALLPLDLKTPFQAETVRLEGKEGLRDGECYRLVLEDELSGRRTLWIDTRSFVLRQVKQEATPESVRRFRRDLEAAVSDGRQGRVLGQRAVRRSVDLFKSRISLAYFTVSEPSGKPDPLPAADPPSQ